jgi:hypothetical protein
MYPLYLFAFTLVGDQKIQLTSSSNKVVLEHPNNAVFLPRSNVKVKEANLNDCAEVQITLEGIYEKQGIEPNHQLLNCKVTISTLDKNDHITPLATCFCSKIEAFTNNFRMYLVADTFRLNNRATQRYSKNCRATFGDQMCKMDLRKISNDYEISAIAERKIFFKVPILEEQHKDSYYDNGTALIDSLSIRVLKHSLEEINAEKGFNLELVVLEVPLQECIIQRFQITKALKVTLTPGCNKTFFTCKSMYKNAINFQGEPFLL